MKISYDKDADVLYITIEDMEAVAEEVSPGNFIRYINEWENPEIAGITIMDFKKRYIE